MATPIARSILSLYATTHAVTCSAAVNQILGTDSDSNSDDDKCDGGGNGLQDLGFLAFLSILLLLVKQVGVSLELEEEVETVEDKHDDSSAVRKNENVVVSALLGIGQGGVKSGGDDQGSRSDCHQRGHGRSNGRVESLFLVFPATTEETATKNEEDVREDTAEHTGLNDTDFALLQSNNRNLDGYQLAWSLRITTNCLAQLHTELFGSKTQESSKRDNSQEVDNENGSRVHVQSSEDNTNRDEDEQDIDIVAGEDGPALSSLRYEFTRVRKLFMLPKRDVLSLTRGVFSSASPLAPP
ncbi:calcium/proton exchanger, partial [Aureobasidium melanogenum]